MPPTISFEAGMPIVDKIRRILLRHPEVITVVLLGHSGHFERAQATSAYHPLADISVHRTKCRGGPGATRCRLAN
jgi:hypothetical protein